MHVDQGRPLFTERTGELSAILGAAYESFLKARLERRAGRRGKVQARDVGTAVEMVAEMIEEASVSGKLWLTVVAELDRDRGEIEADVLEHHGHIEVEHEWAAFVEWVGRFGCCMSVEHPWAPWKSREQASASLASGPPSKSWIRK